MIEDQYLDKMVDELMQQEPSEETYKMYLLMGMDIGRRLGRQGPESRPVLQMDIDNNIICEFPSASQAARTLKLNKGNISNTCNNSNRLTHGGFRWMWKDKYEIINKKIERKDPIRIDISTI